MTSLKTIAEKCINVGTGAYRSCVKYYGFAAPVLKLARHNKQMWFSCYAKLYNGNSATEKWEVGEAI